MKDHDRPAGAARRAARHAARVRRRDDRGRADRATPGGPRRGGSRIDLAGLVRHPAFGVGVAALLIYLPALAYGFVRDDLTLIANNAFLQRDGFLGRLLTSDFYATAGGHSGLWRPAVLFSFWVDGRLSGWEPGWFHAVNLIAHALTSAVVALLLVQAGWTRVAVWLGALWFAWMPAHHESVAWIAGRTDLACALFFLLALWVDRRARARGRRWPGVTALLALGLALLSKEAAVPFVVVVAVAERVGGRSWREAAGWLWPYAALTIVYWIVHEIAAGASAAPEFSATLGGRRLAVLTMLPGYLGFLLPWFPHSPERWLALPASAASPAVIGGALLLLACVATLAWLTWRRSRLALPLALFGLPLAPLFAIGLANGFLGYAERLLYLPSAGAAWLLAWLVDRGWAGGRAIRLGTLVLAIAWVAGSAIALVRTLPMWRSDATMYEAMVARDPGNPEAHVGWAEVLAGRREIEQAHAALDVAESLSPSMTEVHVSRAGLHFRRAEWSQAIASADRALAFSPGRREAQRLRIGALLRLRRVDEAIETLEALRARQPDEPGLASLHGQALLLQGRSAEALVLLETASEWIDDDPGLSFALGNAALIEQRYRLAQRAFDRTVRIDPRYYDGWLRLATASHLAGDRATRDRALAGAAQLPGARDGRVENLRREWDSTTVP